MFQSLSSIYRKTVKRWNFDSIPQRACVVYDVWHHPGTDWSASDIKKRFVLKRCVFGLLILVDGRPKRWKKLLLWTKTDTRWRGLSESNLVTHIEITNFITQFQILICDQIKIQTRLLLNAMEDYKTEITGKTANNCSNVTRILYRLHPPRRHKINENSRPDRGTKTSRNRRI